MLGVGRTRRQEFEDIDLALYLVGGYLNGEISRFVAERMEYVLP